MSRCDECDGVFCYEAYLFDTGVLAEPLLLAESSDRLGGKRPIIQNRVSGFPNHNSSRIYPPNPILSIKAPVLDLTFDALGFSGLHKEGVK